MNDDEIGNEIASSSPRIREYIAQLTAENERLNKALVKKEVSLLSLNSKLKALEEEIKENKPEFKIVMNLGGNSEPT
jgi:predicted  nucleic acid-binding Zn-ribbon protein